MEDAYTKQLARLDLLASGALTVPLAHPNKIAQQYKTLLKYSILLVGT